VSIRRVWIGQASDSEHRRAVGLVSKPGNAPWVFNNVSGRPRGWREEIPEHERKTVYFFNDGKKGLILMVYKFKTTEQRSNLMSKIRSNNTKPEVKLRKTLWGRGFRFSRKESNLPGKTRCSVE